MNQVKNSVFDEMVPLESSRISIPDPSPEDKRVIDAVSLWFATTRINAPFAGLQQRFQKHGLDQLFQSWVGSEKNGSLSPKDMEKVLGAAKLVSLSRTSRLSKHDLRDRLARLLPHVVDELSPAGEMPSDRAFRFLVSSLRRKLGLSAVESS